MQEDVDRVLISQERIASRVRAMAVQITADAARDGGRYPRTDGSRAGETPPVSAAEITIVPILTGAMIFCADLIRQMPLRMKIGLLTVSSYPGATVRSAGAQMIAQQLGDLRDRHILLVDDILDSGQTLGLVIPLLRAMHPASMRTCVLLRKDRAAARQIEVDYIGFDIPDEFVVGYGLDYDNYYRNLPDIVTLKRHVLEKPAARQEDAP